jgi:DNA-binding PadR family transcriptional regulator
MVLSADGERGPSRRSGSPGIKPAKKRLRRAANRALNLLQRTILGSLMDGQPANAYAIVKALRDPNGESSFVESSIYRQITGLVQQGYLELGEEVTARGPRATYSITLKGIEAMQRWARTPASLPIQVANEAWLRILLTSSIRTRDVLQGLSTLPKEVDGRLDDLELVTRVARRERGWSIAAELEYQLEREVLDGCRRWALTATHLLEAELRAQPDEAAGG